MSVTPPATGGPNLPAILSPGNSQLGLIQGGALVFDSATGMWYCPIVLGAGSAVIGTTNDASPYPVGAVPLTGQSGDVAAAIAAATLSSVAGKTTYITGFSVTSTGSTGAATVLVAVTGTITGTLTYVYVTVAGATTANAILSVTFPRPIPASAAHTDIVVTCPSLGTGNLHCAVNAYGFNL